VSFVVKGFDSPLLLSKILAGASFPPRRGMSPYSLALYRILFAFVKGKMLFARRKSPCIGTARGRHFRGPQGSRIAPPLHNLGWQHQGSRIAPPLCKLAFAQSGMATPGLPHCPVLPSWDGASPLLARWGERPARSYRVEQAFMPASKTQMDPFLAPQAVAQRSGATMKRIAEGGAR